MMKLFKFIFGTLSVILIMAGSCLFYAFKIEPYRLNVNEYYLTDKKAEVEPIKIVQFSDLHIKEDFTYKNLQKVVKSINKQTADIVVFTGDLYDNYALYNDDEQIISELKKIETTYGKLAIWGNRDYGGGAVRQYDTIMEQAGFTLLKNENIYIATDDDKKLLFTGFDDGIFGTIKMPVIENASNYDYHILLSHEPDTIESFLDYNYNLILSGHSHGGQVNIPLLPFINKKAVSITSLTTTYVEGLYTMDLNQKKYLYVNTGIGTTHISARFGVVPEIAVFYIYL